jgi:hypothetical protein
MDIKRQKRRTRAERAQHGRRPSDAAAASKTPVPRRDTPTTQTAGDNNKWTAKKRSIAIIEMNRTRATARRKRTNGRGGRIQKNGPQMKLLQQNQEDQKRELPSAEEEEEGCQSKRRSEPTR